jgi:hypothetical protein
MAVYAFGVPVEDVDADEEAELPHPRASIAQEAVTARMREMRMGRRGLGTAIPCACIGVSSW